MTYDQQYPNVSYGRLVDGDTNSPLVYFTKIHFVHQIMEFKQEQKS